MVIQQAAAGNVWQHSRISNEAPVQRLIQVARDGKAARVFTAAVGSIKPPGGDNVAAPVLVVQAGVGNRFTAGGRVYESAVSDVYANMGDLRRRNAKEQHVPRAQL